MQLHAAAPTSNCNNKTWDSRWRAEYNSDSEKSTTKSTEQLDLCHLWQQTNHQHPYLNMCPGPNSLLTQSKRGEEGWDLVEPHDGSENQPPHHSKPSYLSQPGGFFNTSTLVLGYPLHSLFIVLKNKLEICICGLMLSPNTSGAACPPLSNLISHIKNGFGGD